MTKHATETLQSWIRALDAPFVGEPRAPESHVGWSKHTKEKESKRVTMSSYGLLFQLQHALRTNCRSAVMISVTPLQQRGKLDSDRACMWSGIYCEVKIKEVI